MINRKRIITMLLWSKEEIIKSLEVVSERHILYVCYLFDVSMCLLCIGHCIWAVRRTQTGGTAIWISVRNNTVCSERKRRHSDELEVGIRALNTQCVKCSWKPPFFVLGFPWQWIKTVTIFEAVTARCCNSLSSLNFILLIDIRIIRAVYAVFIHL